MAKGPVRGLRTGPLAFWSVLHRQHSRTGNALGPTGGVRNFGRGNDVIRASFAHRAICWVVPDRPRYAAVMDRCHLGRTFLLLPTMRDQIWNYLISFLPRPVVLVYNEDRSQWRGG